jgi:hypothetical protein
MNNYYFTIRIEEYEKYVKKPVNGKSTQSRARTSILLLSKGGRDQLDQTTIV